VRGCSGSDRTAGTWAPCCCVAKRCGRIGYPVQGKHPGRGQHQAVRGHRTAGRPAGARQKRWCAGKRCSGARRPQQPQHPESGLHRGVRGSIRAGRAAGARSPSCRDGKRGRGAHQSVPSPHQEPAPCGRVRGPRSAAQAAGPRQLPWLEGHGCRCTGQPALLNMDRRVRGTCSLAVLLALDGSACVHEGAARLLATAAVDVQKQDVVGVCGGRHRPCLLGSHALAQRQRMSGQRLRRSQPMAMQAGRWLSIKPRFAPPVRSALLALAAVLVAVRCCEQRLWLHMVIVGDIRPGAGGRRCHVCAGSRHQHHTACYCKWCRHRPECERNLA